MKKRFSLCAVLILALLCSMLSGLSIASAAVLDSVPEDWELLYSEDFDNDTGAAISLNTIDYGTDHPQYASNWTYTTINGTDYHRAAINTNGQLNLNHPGSGTKGINVNITLKNPIDLSTDADYYLMYDSNFPGMGNQGSSGIEFSNSNTNSTAKPYFFSGVTMNNGNPPYVPTISADLGGTTVSAHSAIRNYSGGSTPERTMLVQLSIRKGQESTVRYRMFLPGETPSFKPDFWDAQRSWNVTGTYTTYQELNRIVYRGSHNAGNSINVYFDNVRLYKAPPVSSYNTKLNGTTKLIAEAVTNHTMTILDPTNASTSVISKGWYDLSVDPPALLTSDFSYTIPAHMLGKKIKAEITVDCNGVVTTYEPFIGHVRAPIDYTRILSVLDQSDKTYTEWEHWTKTANATTLNTTTFLTVNTDLRASAANVSGSVALITAHYSADNQLKNVYITKSNRKLSDMSGPIFDRLLTQIKVREKNGTVYVEPGDRFKSFVWLSSNNVASGFQFDAMKPLQYNPNTLIKVDEFQVPSLPEE